MPKTKDDENKKEYFFYYSLSSVLRFIFNTRLCECCVCFLRTTFISIAFSLQLVELLRSFALKPEKNTIFNAYFSRLFHSSVRSSSQPTHTHNRFVCLRRMKRKRRRNINETQNQVMFSGLYCCYYCFLCYFSSRSCMHAQMAFGRETNSLQHSSSSLAPLALHLVEQTNKKNSSLSATKTMATTQCEDAIEKVNLFLYIFFSTLGKLCLLAPSENAKKKTAHRLIIWFIILFRNFHSMFCVCVCVVKTDETFIHKSKYLENHNSKCSTEWFLAQRFGRNRKNWIVAYKSNPLTTLK